MYEEHIKCISEIHSGNVFEAAKIIAALASAGLLCVKLPLKGKIQ